VKSHNRNLLIVVVIALVLVVGATAFFMTVGFGEGFTVTSISTSQVITEDTNLRDAWFFVNVVANGGAQSVVGTITPEETKAMSGYETEYPLEIKMSTVSEDVYYNIRNDGIPIYQYRMVEVGALSTCPPGTSWTWVVATGILPSRICVIKDQIGVKGSFESPTTSFNADITLTARGTSITKSISNAGAEGGSVEFWDGNTLRATAQWTGSLVTGDAPPNANNYVATFSHYGDQPEKWRIARLDQWNAYENARDITDNNFNTMDWGDVWRSLDLIETGIDNVNQASYQLVTTDTSFTTGATVVNPTDINNGKVKLSLDRRISFPQILFKVRADWLGVRIPVGKPQIVSISSEPFASGTPGSIEVTVRNIGDGIATFDAVVSGCLPFEQRYGVGTDRITLHPGQTGTIVIQLSHATAGATAEDICRDCTVRVYDYNKPSNYDTRTVQVCMTPVQVCIPDKYWVDGNCIMHCTADGMRVETIKCCDEG